MLDDPALQRPSLDVVDLAVGHDFKYGRKRRSWQPSCGMLLDVADLAVRGIEAAGRLQIKAIPPALGIHDRDRAPLLRHEKQHTTDGEEKVKMTNLVRSRLRPGKP